MAFETRGEATGSSDGTSHTAGNGAKATVTNLGSTTTMDANTMWVAIEKSGTSGRKILVDITDDGTPCVPDLQIDHASAHIATIYGPFPVQVASGSQLGVSASSTTTGATMEVIVYYSDQDFVSVSSGSTSTIGVSTATNSEGTLIPGNTTTANAVGTKTSIGTAPSDCEYFHIIIGRDANTGLADSQGLLSVYYGTSGANTLLQHLKIGASQFDDQFHPEQMGPFNAAILKSQEVFLELRMDHTTANDRDIRASMVFGRGTAVGDGGGASGVRNPLVGPVE